MSEIFVDPKNADIVYVPSQNLYRSTDGGRTFTAIKGAPGGDDYHSVWIDPTNSQRIMLGVDQGATISLDGGESWSPWYNQPTGEFYRVATDHRFPYWVYGPQQDSGTAGIISRGNNGQITERDWFPVGPGEKRLYDSRSAGRGRGLQRGARRERGSFVKTHGTSAGYFACAGFFWQQVQVQLDYSDGFFAAGPIPALSRNAVFAEDGQRRHELGSRERGPDACPRG